MVAYHQMVVVARIIRGLLAGRDGEDVVAEVRASPVVDSASTLQTVALMAILAFAHHHSWEIYLSTALMGIGFGLAFSAMSALCARWTCAA